MRNIVDSVIIGSKVILRKKRLEDAQDDYTWRADPELSRLDASPPVTMSFPHYLLSYHNELNFPSFDSCRFAVDTPDGKHIGNCVYYEIDKIKGEAELGIMIGDRDYWDKGYGVDAVTALVSHIFSRTNLNRVYLKTLESNRRAQRCFQKCGFTPCGRMARDGYKFLLMDVYRKQWKKEQGDNKTG